MRRLAFCCSILLFCGCGGGGGGGIGTTNFAGVYMGQLVATDNTCEFKLDPMDRTYTVNQDGQRVVLDSSGGSVFEGTVTGDSKFVVSNTSTDNCINPQTSQVIPNSMSQSTDTITFEFTDSNNVQVTYMNESGNCTGNSFINSSACHYTMIGTFERKQ